MTSVTDNAIAMIESDQMQKRTVASVGRRIKIRPGHATQHHLHSSSFHWQMKLLHQRGVSKRCCTTTTGSWERSSRAFAGKYNASPHGKDERSRGRKKNGSSERVLSAACSAVRFSQPATVFFSHVKSAQPPVN